MLCGIACIIMGIIGNVPLGMVIGMGLAPYFTYNVVGFHGSGNVRRGFCVCDLPTDTQVSYGTAVTAVLFTGLFFVILSVSGVRGKLIKSMPKSLLFAITAGIGMFLTHLGLQQADGLGIVTYQSATLVTMGAVEGLWYNMMLNLNACAFSTLVLSTSMHVLSQHVCFPPQHLAYDWLSTLVPAGGCPRADRAPQYTIADPATVCVLPPGGNASTPIEPNLGPPSSNYTCCT